MHSADCPEQTADTIEADRLEDMLGQGHCNAARVLQYMNIWQNMGIVLFWHSFKRESIGTVTRIVGV